MTNLRLACFGLFFIFACGDDDATSEPDATAASFDGGSPDAPAGATCDGDHLVSGDGCAADKCSLQFSQSGMIEVGCCPAGAVTSGGACNPVAEDSLDHEGFVCDDCAIGLVCVGFVCHPYCDARDLLCPAGEGACMPASGIPDAPHYGHCE